MVRGCPENLKDIDGITFEMIEEFGVEEYLQEIKEELVRGKYRPLTKERLINGGFYDLAAAYQSVHVNY